MSIESSLKSIAESLKESVELQKQLLANLVELNTKGASRPEPSQAVPAEPEPVVTTPSEDPGALLPPLTTAEIEDFNNWLADMVTYLGEGGEQRIREVMNAQGLKTLVDMGDSRAAKERLQAEVMNLQPAGTEAA